MTPTDEAFRFRDWLAPPALATSTHTFEWIVAPGVASTAEQEHFGGQLRQLAESLKAKPAPQAGR